MRWIRRLTMAWRSLFRRAKVEQELDLELQFHLDQQTAEHLAAGMGPDEARAAALRSIGNVTRVKDACRDSLGVRLADDLRQDVRFAVRTLARAPGFTSAAILSLAVGIGFNTAIFTLIDSMLLAPLPYPEADRVVMVWSVSPDNPGERGVVTVPDFLAWREQQRSFAALGAMSVNPRDLGAADIGTPAERVQAEQVTPEMLRVFGIQPTIGRYFTAAESEFERAPPVVILSHRLWQRRFGGRSDVLNTSILVNGSTARVIGVMPERFRPISLATELLDPMRFNEFQRRGSNPFLLVFGRLKPGVSIQQAQEDLGLIAGHLAKDFPQRNTLKGKPWGVRVQSLHEGLFDGLSTSLLLLQGAVAFVLLIACANVAGLLIVRAATRQGEVAIRAALGASRARIVRQFLAESLVLSGAGGILGVAVAWWGVRAMTTLAPADLPGLEDTAIDASVLAFSALLSIATGVVFGLAPALLGSRPDLQSSIKDSVRSSTSGAATHRMRGSMVVLQMALALMLLCGAGLLIRSFLQLKNTPLNGDPSGLLTFQIGLSRNQFGKPVATYKGFPQWELNARPGEIFTQMHERLRSVPGVQSAAGTLFPPFTPSWTVPFVLGGRSAEGEKSARYHPVTVNYFHTMKVALVRGRDFSERDTAGAPWVAIVNETMARQFWSDGNPIGQRLTLSLSADERPREIVGVARDTPTQLAQTQAEAAVFVPLVQVPPHTIGPFVESRMQITFVVRTSNANPTMMPALRQAVSEIDPNLPLANVRSVEQYLDMQVAYPRAYAVLLGLFAAVATLLAAIGLYGTMAYTVAQRTREIGIRMALGAGLRQIVVLIARQAVPLVGLGLLLGLLGALILTRLLSAQLWHVTPTDPLTFTMVALLLLVVAILACVVPTWRAIRVNSILTLRQE
jgi:putative ABC transport system permease protein